MRHALEETLGGFLRPGIPEGIGFAVGFTILARGLSVRARRRHLERIEQKIDHLAADEPAQGTDRGAAAREGRRRRRVARRRNQATQRA
jgi:hypothetical protein